MAVVLQEVVEDVVVVVVELEEAPRSSLSLIVMKEYSLSAARKTFWLQRTSYLVNQYMVKSV